MSWFSSLLFKINTLFLEMVLQSFRNKKSLKTILHELIGLTMKLVNIYVWGGEKLVESFSKTFWFKNSINFALTNTHGWTSKADFIKLLP